MANVTISGLSTSATIANDADLLELEQGGASKKVTARNFIRGLLLGTVSQSGGTPTGAVIERGSNANGEYVKFADGTMICTLTINDDSTVIATSSVGGYRSPGQSWTLPSVFSAVPVFIGAALVDTAISIVFSGSSTTSTGIYSYTSVTSQTTATRGVFLLAIGRWY